jgi:hypothetical protein
MRTRRDVWKLAADPTDKTLYWYSIAVAEMQSRMFDNVNSWKFQAAVHGYDASLYPPLRSGENLPSQPIQQKYWDNCQPAGQATGRCPIGITVIPRIRPSGHFPLLFVMRQTEAVPICCTRSARQV